MRPAPGSFATAGSARGITITADNAQRYTAYVKAAESIDTQRLIQPKVRYAFADPELEGRSAGQKVLVGIGIDNELRLKAKLREIRSALIAGAKRT